MNPLLLWSRRECGLQRGSSADVGGSRCGDVQQKDRSDIVRNQNEGMSSRDVCPSGTSRFLGSWWTNQGCLQNLRWWCWCVALLWICRYSFFWILLGGAGNSQSEWRRNWTKFVYDFKTHFAEIERMREEQRGKREWMIVFGSEKEKWCFCVRDRGIGRRAERNWESDDGYECWMRDRYMTDKLKLREGGVQ